MSILTDPMFTAYEPRLFNRFIVKINDSLGEPIFPSYAVCGIDLPTFDAKKKLYNGVSVRFYDPIIPSMTVAVYQNTDKTWFITVQELGPVGDIVGQWEISGNPSTVQYGKLQWGTADVKMLTVNIDVADVKLCF